MGSSDGVDVGTDEGKELGLTLTVGTYEGVWLGL